MRRSGTADLPLHYGRLPEWLYTRMKALGREIVRAIVEDAGSDEVLRRISDPFWFQALGCVLGMDWHSSGITTSVMGALKSAINPLFHDLGLYVCGGRGKHALQTPDELMALCDRTGLNGTELVRASKLSAKVDNACVLDGYSLYLHSFIVSKTGGWAVVQQGMNADNRMARRYHWRSAHVTSFVDDPQSAVIGSNQGRITNLSDSRAAKNRRGIVEFLGLHPDKQRSELRRLTMPRPHQVTPDVVDGKRLGAVLTLAHERQFCEFTDALLLPGVGPRTIQSLALVSEVIYGGPSRFDDPARFAFAHGGKDGSPFPVPLKAYDECISVLRRAVDRAKVDASDKMRSIKALHRISQAIEQNLDPFADVKKVIRHERQRSHAYGGMTIHGPAPTPPEAVQLSIFGQSSSQRKTHAPIMYANESPEHPTQRRQPRTAGNS